jgi:rifampicin phosphotransferase
MVDRELKGQTMSRFILRDTDADLQGPLGGKARALAALRDAGLPIPPWIVLSPEAFHASLTPELRTALESALDGAETRQLLEGLRPSSEVEAELRQALAERCPVVPVSNRHGTNVPVGNRHHGGELLAVRSSASDEDGAQHSFAGQLDSFLFVSPDEVPAKAAAVWRSGFGDRVLAYRREHGLGLIPQPPAVLIQKMIRADAAGVGFGADPVSGRRGVAVVAAVYGLGSGLVSGECDADTYHIDRDGKIILREIADKRTAHRAAPQTEEGVESVPVPEEQARKPALEDAQILAVAELVRHAGRHFGRPQDIEWAIEGGKLHLLQSRPITSLTQVADPDGALNLWDNSNIAESYNGVTTPLTFSFARRAYEEVYRQFCRILRVPESVVTGSDDIFRHMLGLIRGRVYYNLLNWYRLLTLLPGFKTNRGFMEQMMGVKERLPEELVGPVTRPGWRERLRDRFRLLGSMAAMIRNHFSIGRQIRHFYDRLNHALGTGRPDLDRLRPDELAAYYRDLERQLLTRWDAPLVNDFFAMIFYGTLGKLTRKWCQDKEGTLQNDLLCGEGGMISAEPAARVRALAETARPDPALVDALCAGSLQDIRLQMDRLPAFRVLYQEYLDRSGDRCMEELKLESPTLHDDPLTLLRSIGQMTRRLAREGPQNPTGSDPLLRRKAEERVRSTLRFRPLRRLLFLWVLKNARARVRDRENLRFERTRLFGRVRMIFVALGRKLHALDLLDQPRDIFYLELEEVLGFVEGTATCADLRGLVAIRRAEFDRYRQAEVPADRFETRGIIHQGNDFRSKTTITEEPDGDRRKGLGCCPGVVRGRARVITDPRNATLEVGDILVAERTDPGWIMLFPSAAGLLVERGSLLSHSAIVAREMGIPAIVSLAGVTRWLKTGDHVELDGSTGIVTKVTSAP